MELLVGVGLVVLIILNIAFFRLRKKETNHNQQLNIKSNEQIYHSLYQYNPDMTITYDLDGNMISVNKVVESYGYTEEETLHQSFISFIAPDQLEKTLEHFQIAKSGKSTNYETSLYSKNGDRFELCVTNIPIIVNNEIVGVFGNSKDITELKKTQQALVEAEEKYRNLAEDALVGIYIIQDEKFVYVNRRLIEMFDYRKDQIIGMEAMEFVYPEDRVMVAENMNKRLQDNFSNIQYQYREIKKDKTKKLKVMK